MSPSQGDSSAHCFAARILWHVVIGEPEAFRRIVETARAADVTDNWIADLASQLAESGDLIRNHSGPAADIPSTGGPSSLSTLLCPLFLSAAGLLVPKLGVPGRPAGGLDVMAQVPGYRTQLEPSEVRSILETCRYAHFDAAGRIAPMDGRLFVYRQSTGAQTVVPLVIASILSKKLAVGVERVGLDIRVADHGNFGATLASAKKAASQFIRVAALLGIKAKAFMTDANHPYQPYIGRGEALLALHAYFTGAAEPWLARHVDQCLFMASQLCDNEVSSEISVIRQQFDAHLAAQGSDPGGFSEIVRRLKEQRTFEIHAGCDGYAVFDLERIRNALVVTQRSAPVSSGFPDPAGVVLLIEPDSFVMADQPVMRVRSEIANIDSLTALLRGAVAISRFPQTANVDVVNA